VLHVEKQMVKPMGTFPKSITTKTIRTKITSPRCLLAAPTAVIHTATLPTVTTESHRYQQVVPLSPLGLPAPPCHLLQWPRLMMQTLGSRMKVSAVAKTLRLVEPSIVQACPLVTVWSGVWGVAQATRPECCFSDLIDAYAASCWGMGCYCVHTTAG